MNRTLVLFLVFGLVALGCVQEEIEYTCSDGRIVSDPVDCSITEENISVHQCPTSCDDGNPCTIDYCDSSTSHNCVHDTLLDGTSCGPDLKCKSGVCGPIAPQKPSYIEDFVCIDEGSDRLRCYFQFDTKRSYDGTAKFRLVDMEGNDIYTQNIQFESSDFVEYHYVITGTEAGDTFEWYIPTSSIEKSFGEEISYLTVTLPDGTNLSAIDDTIEYEDNLPRYTDEEIKNLYEEEYLNSSVTINKKLSIGDDMEFTLVSYGYFNFRKYGWGPKEKYLRFDIEVKNNDDREHYFYVYDAALIDNIPNQYEKAYSGSDDEFEGGRIYPGITKKGYVLFEDIDASATSAKLVFTYDYKIHEVNGIELQQSD